MNCFDHSIDVMGDDSDAVRKRCHIAFHIYCFSDWFAVVVVEILRFKCSEEPSAATVNKPM